MNTACEQFETIDLGIGTVDVRFLRGVHGGESGWWCIRTGKDFDYADIGFRYAPLKRGKTERDSWWTPDRNDAANALHMSFCDATGEGLSIPVATPENVELVDRFDRDGLLFRVKVKRTVTQRINNGGVH